ncbi:MAG: DUF3619 family protein [Rhodocyclaceae bacterium]|nr:DUF3619 family protein [Rhodocyclaceae bacterium]
MNNEELQIAYKVRQALNHGVEHLDSATAKRLFEARQQALAHHRGVVGGLQLAGVGPMIAETFHHGRRLLAVLALALGVVGTYYWNQFEQASENEEIDSALLADDLPPSAYLDRGFQAWLEHSKTSPDR